jgi:hypothetical protein
LPCSGITLRFTPFGGALRDARAEGRLFVDRHGRRPSNWCEASNDYRNGARGYASPTVVTIVTVGAFTVEHLQQAYDVFPALNAPDAEEPTVRLRVTFELRTTYHGKQLPPSQPTARLLFAYLLVVDKRFASTWPGMRCSANAYTPTMARLGRS